MKKNYTRALLSFASNRRFPAPSPIAFSESGANAKKRIKHALYWKKPRFYINLLCVLLCAIVLVACATDADGFEWKKVKTETFGENPYNIVYRSNGDGTCNIAEIRVDKDYTGDIHLVIPEKAPNGDTVVGIKNAWGFTGGEAKNNLPIYLSFDDMNELTESIITAKDITAKQTDYGTVGSNSERDAKIIKAFYAEKIDGEGNGYYELEPSISLEERIRLTTILDVYGYDEEDCYNDTAAFLDSLDIEDEEKNLFAREAFKYLYHYGENITEITLPESVKFICYGAFDGCDNLKKVNGISNSCVLELGTSSDTNPDSKVCVVINGADKNSLKTDEIAHDANEDFVKALD